MSLHHFHEFCNLTKLGIEIRQAFVYNVLIAVPGTEDKLWEGCPSRKEY